MLIPPTRGGPRFDAAMLIRTTSPATITQVQASTTYHRLNPAFSMTARNIRRIGQTDSTRSATFLFNHFTAPDRDGAVEKWEQLTGWYTAKIGVDNFTLLQPIDNDAPYSVVNYVRLPTGPIQFLANQFTRPSFHRYVRAHLRSNSMTAMPILFKRV